MFIEVNIPESKKKSYALVEKLLNNYKLRRRGSEDVSNLNEENEVIEFLQYAIQTDVMNQVKRYAEDNGHISRGASSGEWIEKLRTIWFETFHNNSTCGFEHVFVGEEGSGNDPNPCRRNGQSRELKKLGGHHFWYHYYLHDGPYTRDEVEDSIIFLDYVEVNLSERSRRAEVITIRYIYDAKDEENERGMRLYKETGGFFVGSSPIGLLAIGTVTMLYESNKEGSTISITINDEDYDLVVWREGNHLRT